MDAETAARLARLSDIMHNLWIEFEAMGKTCLQAGLELDKLSRELEVADDPS